MRINIKNITHYIKNIEFIEQLKIEGQTRKTCQAGCLCFFFILDRKRELGHTFFSSLVIAWLAEINPITLFLQTQRGFFFFSVADRGP
jgi:hypothetical protein